MFEEFGILALLLLSGCLLMHASRNLLGLWLKIGLLLACLLAVFQYSNYGSLNAIFPKDPAYKAKYGNQAKHILFHWHENYHYYLGAKYFPELGYKGLYETIAYADSQSAAPQLKAIGLRSLRAPTHPIPMAEGLRRGREEFRPRFTEARWKSFTEDLEAMKAIADTRWLDIGMFDAGYNPPPSWAVLGYTIANLVPISQEHGWGDLRPEWYQFQYITLFDPLILAIGMGFVCWAFGWLGMASFLLFFCLNEAANFSWIAGSFFRYTFLVELMIGISCLKKKHYVPAGIFMGLAGMDRIFPFAFLAAAGLALLADNYRSKNYTPFFTFTTSALAGIAAIGGISTLMFGLSAWQGFFEKILAHKDIYFVHHIGYRRIAVFSTDILNQDFWWERGLDRFRAWNEKLNATWNSVRLMHYVLWAVLIAAATFASLRARAEEAALLLGGLLFFLFEIGANYYYIYFPLVFVVLLGTPITRVRQLLLTSFIALWAALWYYHFNTTDDLVNNYHKCWSFFIFFCVWVFARAGETLLQRLRERPKNVTA